MENMNNLRESTIQNCKKICSNLGHDAKLYEQKYKGLINIIEHNYKNVSYMSPINFYIAVYNESIKQLNNTVQCH